MNGLKDNIADIEIKFQSLMGSLLKLNLADNFTQIFLKEKN